MFDKLIAVLAPHSCLVCGREGAMLCAWCRQDACLPAIAVCYSCRSLSPDFATCAKCRKKSPLKMVCVATDYRGTAKTLVHNLKFGRAMAAAGTLAAVMDDTLPFLNPETIVTFVPAATGHVRVRGYDQSKLIARAVANGRNLRNFTLLRRSGQERQVGSDRSLRLKQLKNKYRPVKTYLIKGADILLIDDVITTGATLEEAARTLKQAGAKSVSAAVFAR